MYSNEREKERAWVWLGGRVGRVWKGLEGRNNNWNILYRKKFSIEKKYKIKENKLNSHMKSKVL